jgi:diadenosine tetraphosphate (Ap4A) HIT family hydrolase
VALDSALTRVLRDLYPVTAGHLLVTPKRHVSRWSDAAPEEKAALLADVERATSLLAIEDETVAGFNIGWNDGEVAGQTVMHLHVHVIPRRRGDTDDPRGGVRWVMPRTAAYWKP